MFFFTKAWSLHLFYTAAIIDEQYEMRKNEYLYSLKVLDDLGIHPYILESCKTESFFDPLPYSIFYTRTNNSRLFNKGVNEANSLIKGFEKYKFEENSIIIKLTGRYFFTSRNFISYIENHPKIDAFIKRTENSSIFTGCFALRCCYFQKFLRQLDLKKMEREKISIEDELYRFLINNPSIKVLQLDSLDVTANIFGEGNCQLTHW